MKAKIILILGVYFSLSVSAFAGGEPEKMINRNVLILDFLNSNNSSDYSYMEISIPDALSEKLHSTKKFELLKRNIWKAAALKNKYNPEDVYNEDIALNLARVNSADVVIIGSFAISGEYIQMYAKAIEVSSGRIMVTQKQLSKLDSNMFQAIDLLANAVAAEMQEKLPPVPQRVVTEEKIQYMEKPRSKTVDWSDKIFSITPGIGFMGWQPQLDSYLYEAFIPSELTFSLDLRLWLWQKLQLTLALASVNGHAGDYFLNSNHITLFAGYRIPVDRWSFYAEAGVGYADVSFLNYLKFYQNFEIGAGIGFDFLIFNFLSAGLNSRILMLYDNPAPLFNVMMGFSISFIFKD